MPSGALLSLTVAPGRVLAGAFVLVVGVALCAVAVVCLGLCCFALVPRIRRWQSRVADAATQTVDLVEVIEPAAAQSRLDTPARRVRRAETEETEYYPETLFEGPALSHGGSRSYTHGAGQHQHHC